MSREERKVPKSKIDVHTCKCPGQDAIHGNGRRVWNPRFNNKTGRFVGWACTACGLKVVEY
jgi:hypothetical protein